MLELFAQILVGSIIPLFGWLIVVAIITVAFLKIEDALTRRGVDTTAMSWLWMLVVFLSFSSVVYVMPRWFAFYMGV